MPLIRVTAPAGIIDTERRRHLAGELMRGALKWEVGEADDSAAQAISWVLFDELPADGFTVAGEPRQDCYLVDVTVPAGSLSARRRQGLVAELTEVVLESHPANIARDPRTVWVHVHDLADGSWGSGGRVWRLDDIRAHVTDARPAGAAR